MKRKFIDCLCNLCVSVYDSEMSFARIISVLENVRVSKHQNSYIHVPPYLSSRAVLSIPPKPLSVYV